MSSKKVTIGIFGAGRIGQVHLGCLVRNPNAVVKRVVDPFLTESVEEKILAMGVQYASKDANDILNDDEIDAVFICSSTDTHFELSLGAIAKNKHVFCEKPVDLDITKVVKVKEALENSDIVYQVGFNRRFDHNFSSAKKALLEKKIGTPQMIRITSRDPSPPPIEYIKVSGGLFLDMMIHDFDILRFITGSEVEEVFAYGGVLVDEEIGEAGDIDSAIVSCKLKNGMLGYIENCRQAIYGYDQRLEVLGTDGSVSILNDTESTAIVSNSQGVVQEKPMHFFLERYKEAYEKEQRAFITSILEGEPVDANIIAGYESVRLAYAAKLSLAEHRPVKISEI